MLPEINEAAVWAIFFLPVAALVAIAVVTYPMRRVSGYVAIAAIFGSWLLSLWALDTALQADGHVVGFEPHRWVEFGPLSFAVQARLDGLTAVMLVVVTSVALMVQVYSQGYMEHDTGYSRYYAYLSLFSAAMLGLVLSANILMVFIFWELVGLASYLLIGFWFHKPAAAAAAKKAFITTRVGDVGFLLAVLLVWNELGTFDIAAINEAAHGGVLAGTVLTLFALGLLAGAMGKSAQFPLHVWLPDAMEGPTPVSALIHAATMVAAGVYLVGRMFPVFEAADDARLAVAWVGGFTALFAATMGVVMTDIKRVLAYSTISQLGYMFLALGVGGYVAGLFHLTTHAFFKALLFLGSGSVNHATNTFDMRRMGGLGRAMPWTFATFLVGALALAGIFPLAGFWSKDEILKDAWNENQPLFWLGLAVAFLTAFYMFRAIFLTFTGEYRGGGEPEHEPAAAHGAHEGSHGAGTPGPHESGWVMVLPLVLLAVPAVLIGLWNVGGDFAHLVNGALPEGVAHEVDTSINWGIAVGSTGVALAGIGLAWLIYGTGALKAEAIRRAFGPVATLVEQRYYLDHLYEGVLVRRVLYGGISQASALLDARVVDGAVNGAAGLTRWAGSQLRRAQTGQLQGYGVAFAAGVVVIIAAILIINP